MRRRNQSSKGGMYIAIFIAFIMISSVIGYLYTGDSTADPTLSYNGFSFTAAQQGWITTINKQQTTFTYHPTETIAVQLPLTAVQLLLQGQVFVSYNPNSTDIESFALAQFEMVNALQQKNIPAMPATTQETEYNTTVMDCTKGKTVLVFQESNENSIRLEDTCIIASGNPLLLKDRILYGLYGVIP